MGVKSSALWDLMRGAARNMLKSRVQITLVVSFVELESCTDSGFAAGTSSSRATVRRTSNCFTTHISKLGKRKQCVLCAISFFCSWRRNECIRTITSRYFLHDQLIARISRHLRLWSSKRDDATICGS